ncbi:hypothetical protein EJP77_02805 [Paenibacillus zeisoli]|uniref:ParA family protein n=1 Tax=Paenibacillus zeisoli TaxID=2496267 RepID=A0A3S1BBW6_9BACL|nr:hypothetical protein [Paenibacillus zeisoli]RUT35945.1 hypothetical protein EJP77_02805 [Paenibacillus zeisoli]
MTTVAFWDYGQIGTSELAVPLAVMTSLDYRIRLLLTQTGKRRTGIDEAFKVDKSYAADLAARPNEQGMDALMRLSASGILDRNNISDYTIPLISGRLDMAPGPEFGESGLLRYQELQFNHLLQVANERYDCVLIDSPGTGTFNEMTLKGGEVTVILLRQNNRLLETYFEEAKYNPMLTNKPHVLVIHHYDADQHCSISNIKRKYGYKAPIFGIPYCREYANAWNSQEVIAFFQRNYNRLRRNTASEKYMDAVRRLSQKVMELADIQRMPSSGRGA